MYNAFVCELGLHFYRAIRDPAALLHRKLESTSISNDLVDYRIFSHLGTEFLKMFDYERMCFSDCALGI